MIKSIFGRMFWTYAIILLIVFSFVSMSMAMFLGHYTVRKQVEKISSVAYSIEYWAATLQIEQTDAYSKRSFDNFLSTWSKFTKSDITITDRDGDVFISTCGIKSVPEKALSCIDDGRFTVYKSDFNGFYDNSVLTVAVPMHYQNNIIGAIIFNSSTAELRRTSMELLIMLLVSASMSMLLALLIIYIQAKKISSPITRINSAAQKIAAGNFEERVNVESRDEIGQLASTFNFMASSIEKYEKNRRQFISDISHELRTPMTSISGFVRGMLDGTITEDMQKPYLQIVLDESVRLTDLVNDMLEMSKIENEKFKLDISSFDINDLICTSIIGLEQRINDNGLDVNVDLENDRLITVGDKNQIKRVIINLLDNAIKFAMRGSVINIKTYSDSGKAYTEISNQCEKIDDEDIAHLFDRFYKTDKSREKDRFGAGLGLALAQNIMRLHNQQITAASAYDPDTDKHTITFRFSLETE